MPGYPRTSGLEASLSADAALEPRDRAVAVRDPDAGAIVDDSDVGDALSGCDDPERRECPRRIDATELENARRSWFLLVRAHPDNPGVLAVPRGRGRYGRGIQPVGIPGPGGANVVPG